MLTTIIASLFAGLSLEAVPSVPILSPSSSLSSPRTSVLTNRDPTGIIMTLSAVEWTLVAIILTECLALVLMYSSWSTPFRFDHRPSPPCCTPRLPVEILEAIIGHLVLLPETDNEEVSLECTSVLVSRTWAHIYWCHVRQDFQHIYLLSSTDVNAYFERIRRYDSLRRTRLRANVARKHLSFTVRFCPPAEWAPWAPYKGVKFPRDSHSQCPPLPMCKAYCDLVAFFSAYAPDPVLGSRMPSTLDEFFAALLRQQSAVVEPRMPQKLALEFVNAPCDILSSPFFMRGFGVPRETTHLVVHCITRPGGPVATGMQDVQPANWYTRNYPDPSFLSWDQVTHLELFGVSGDMAAFLRSKCSRALVLNEIKK
ncbi:hypothetical protein GGX14DRAFT_468004 [Mycena pura]|uniref:Uncharacterized protein n=1 Tax=Mycena pura TaxID=153505 RepID=A0AAD6V7R4_9AGAR|nr:hypothetical protein GGX14DRAFT_468004 [Mycena pura]